MARDVREELLPQAERLRQVVGVVGGRQAAAELAGVTVQQIWRYLSGRSAAPADVLSKLSLASGFRLEWVVSGTGEREGSRSGASVIALGRSPAAVAALHARRPELSQPHQAVEGLVARVTLGAELLRASGAVAHLAELRAWSSDRHESSIVGLLSDVVTDGPREQWAERARVIARAAELAVRHVSWGPADEAD